MFKQTPPMGWNSWNTFGADINEKLIFETADRMADGGLLSHGYEYLVIDDCWSLKTRDSNGRLVPDPEKDVYKRQIYKLPKIYFCEGCSILPYCQTFLQPVQEAAEVFPEYV